MTRTSPSRQFPDVIYELCLRVSYNYPLAPTLAKERILARLVDGVYHKPGGFKIKAESLNRIGRIDPNERPCRVVACLEEDIPENIERMRRDLMLEVVAKLREYEGYKVLFAGDLKVEEEYDLHPVIKTELEESPSP